MKINDLIHSIKIKNVVLPEFQREYVWSKDQAKKLMASLAKEYPVGSLLFWKTDNPPELKNLPNISHNNSYQIILDGQQRLTTLYMLINGQIPFYYTNEDIINDPRDLFFNIDSGEFQYYQTNVMVNDPLWVRVVDCFDTNKEINVFSLAEDLSQDNKFPLAMKYTNNLQKLRNIKDRELPILLVPASATLEDAIDIFDLVNSQGTKLTDAELALTHIVGNWPQARQVIKNKIQDLKTKNFNFNLTFMTRALTTVVSKRALYEAIHGEPKEKLKDGWKKLSKIMDYLVLILPNRAFIHSTYDLNTTNVLIPIIAYLNENNEKFPDDKNLKRAIHFIYIALAWARYSGQTDQKLEHDVSIMYRENNPWEKLVDALIDQRGRIEVKPNDLEGRTAGHPLYLITYIISKTQGATDWFNGMPLTGKETGSYTINSHHIFPSSILYKNSYDADNHLHRKIVNEIANRAFLTGDTNKSLSNTPPEEYLPSIEENYPGALSKQFIPMQPDLWKIDRYADFLEARRHLIATKINEYFNGLITEPIKVKEKSIKEIITLGESAVLEFKSTLQWDVVRNEKNKALRKAVLKSVAAFLNSDGGTLVIGVEDNGHIFGISKDLMLTENSVDKFLNLVNMLICDNIGPEYASQVKTRLDSVDEGQVCIIDIEKSLIPAYLNTYNQKEFFVRMNNTTRSLDPEETVKYINQNFN
jgi:hypothetical protein